MSTQLSFNSLAFQEKKKVTKREQFLSEMEQVVPWSLLESLIEPHYPKAGNGRPPMPLKTMVRIYCMQQWFQLSDPGMEDALYDSLAMQRFAGLDLGHNAVPDETTILKFRHLLEVHGLPAQIFTATQGYLEGKGLMVRQGTIMDATIIHAPSSTKNREQARDPEMSSTKKGNQWYFGMKAHIGVDSRSGLVHTVICATASEHDSVHADDLLHGDESEGYGDKAYDSQERRDLFGGRGMKYRITLRAARGRELTKQEEKWNKSRNKVRAKVEHVFGVVKNLWGYRKTRYRGITKNACQQFTLFTLANLYLARGRLKIA
jgi:IS5 family transposase